MNSPISRFSRYRFLGGFGVELNDCDCDWPKDDELKWLDFSFDAKEVWDECDWGGEGVWKTGGVL